MNPICVFLGVIFIIAGLGFARGKKYPRSSNWRNLSSKEWKETDNVPLRRNVGGVIMLSGFIFLSKGMMAGFTKKWFTIAMISWFMVAVLDLLYIEKSGKYRGKTFQTKNVERGGKNK